jgi:quinol monooxygenase YgiN
MVRMLSRPCVDHLPVGTYRGPDTPRKETGMKFLQTISYTTSRPDEIKALSDQFEQETPDAPGFLGVKVLKDRDRDNAYTLIAEFDSYERAMENSARPETDAMARKMAELCDGPPEFRNYDVLEDQAS